MAPPALSGRIPKYLKSRRIPQGRPRGSQMQGSGQGRDPLQLLALAEPVEAAGLPGQLRQAPVPEEAPLQPAGVPPAQATGCAVPLGALGAEAVPQAPALEQQIAQAGGDRALVLQAEQEQGGQVLVHLTLQL